MKQRGRKFIFLLLTVMFVSMTGFQPALVQAEDNINLQAESAILVEANTGKILFEKNADESLPPASMSKMMTEYLVMEAIEEGQFTWETKTEASEYAHYLGGLDDTSRVWLALGEQRTVEELFTAMAVYSANDATVALAELVAGSEQAFVEMMNEKAAELGMTNSHFVNSTGLPNSMLGSYIPAGSPEDENAMSARDTALLARALVNDFPKVLEFTSIPQTEPGYFDVNLINFNWMLAGHPEGQAQAHTYDGVDGLKTGFTDLAGYCFAGTAQRDNVRLISVVMRTDSMGARFEETAKLLDFGFNEFTYEELAAEGEVPEELQTLPVAQGKEKEVPLALGGSLSAFVHKDEADKYAVEVVPDEQLLNKDGQLSAPLSKGDVVGEVKLTYAGDRDYGYLDQESTAETVPLVVTEDVEKIGWLRQLMRSVGNLFSGLWTSVLDGVKGWFS